MFQFRTIICSHAVLIILLSLFISGCGFRRIGGRTVNSIKDSSHSPNYSVKNEGIMAGSVNDFSINVGNRILFDLDSASIRPDAQQILALQAKWLASYPHHTVTIEGHADERGTREYNLALGQRRAVVVRDYLVSLGISPERIKIISYGKERPVAFCDNFFCWEQNRRAVTVVD